MDYTFTNDITAKDFWVLTMTQTYKAFTGIINIIFTVGMIGLLIKFYSPEHVIRNILIVIGILIFPVFQPLCMYLYSMKQVEGIPKGMTLSFNGSGMHVATMTDRENIGWKKISRIIKAKNMIILYTASNSGYMISNRMLDGKKDEFYEYCVGNMKRA